MSESEHPRRSARSGELPPGKLDVIYIGGFPPVWRIWKRKGMVTIQPSEARREAANGVERGGECREVEAEHSARSGELPPGKLDVIYIGGFPPVWQIWKRKGMVTIQPSEARREAADGVEWGGERRGVEAEHSARSGELPPGKLDVIYTSGFPPVWQIWRRPAIRSAARGGRRSRTGRRVQRG